ncbi:MAG: glycoside hydrolase family 13 protein [Acidimicrobiia bacterium]
MGHNQVVSSFLWWRHAVTYQVYLRSFADGNGDGTGDIAGLRSRLPYLRSLGVHALWINPWYESPLNDGGYDVADYRRIDPRFGTLEEAVDLIQEARSLGLRVILDLVPNHTSSEHVWFKEALSSSPGSPARDRYHFRPGNGADESRPPNNWRSVFGGPGWTRAPDGEWYLHLFDPTQPDLNWGNDEVRAEFREIIRFWLDRGASGFRVDVAHGLTKDTAYPDLEEEAIPMTAYDGPDHPFWDRDLLHDVVREWRAVIDEYPGSILVAEAWVSTWERLALYLRPDEYHQAFDFQFLMSPWERDSIMKAVDSALDGAGAVGSAPTWVLSNHDVVRHPTRYALPQDLDARTWLLDGDRSLLAPEMGMRRARAAILLMLALPGSAYIYQGEELGLPEVHDLPLEVLDDPVWGRSNHTRKGRDGCRVPIPWTVEGASYGFGSNGSWMPQPSDWGRLSVEAEEGAPGSTLGLYRQALELRADYLAGDETFEWDDAGSGALAFRRGRGVIVVVNFGPGSLDLPEGDVLVSSAPLETGRLPADSAVWISAATT